MSLSPETSCALPYILTRVVVIQEVSANTVLFYQDNYKYIIDTRQAINTFCTFFINTANKIDFDSVL